MRRNVMRFMSAAVLLAILGLQPAAVCLADEAATDRGGQPSFENGWPRVIQSDEEKIVVYQPQLERWQNNHLVGRAAVSVETKANPQTKYGVMWFEARTEVDKETRLVTLDDVVISKVTFPAETADQDRYLSVLKGHAPDWSGSISLDRIEAMLTFEKAERRTKKIEVNNDPPRIIVSTRPAILMLVDGPPTLRPAGASSLLRVINTRALLWQDQETSTYWMPLGEKFVSASSLDGPWKAAEPPAAVSAAAKAVIDAEQKADAAQAVSDDQGSGPGSHQKAETSQAEAKQEAPPPNTLPDVYVSTVPAELVVLDGEPKYSPISGTQLLAATNTTGNLFVYVPDQETYVLLSGRWFKGKSLTGPWQYVAQDQLPTDFAHIPENDPKGGVLASVAGTPSAQEAAIANTVPQTATVKRSEASFEPTYDGEPKFEAIESTPLSYAVNTPTPVIRINERRYYAVSNGVWFAAPSPVGPWAATDRVPAVIYTIPPSSPVHYVTYVRVYDATPDVIYVGYTPGYMGSYLCGDGVVVYGTGWYYRPWIGAVWYGAPVTWGFSAGFGWNSWGGWGWSFGWGWHSWWGPGPFYHPWWGPWAGFHGWWHGGWGWGGWYGGWLGARWAGRNVAVNNYNIYNHWGGNVVVNHQPVRSGVNAAHQTVAAPGTQHNVANGTGGHGVASAGSRPTNNLFAGKDGTVYRRGNSGWERNDGKTWQPVHPGTGGEGVRSLEGENFKRKLGESRVQGMGAKHFNAKGQNLGAGRAKPNKGGGGGGKKPKK
ncbi:MAG: hypothetical protein ACHQQS_17195 [Thermoanaerobaculales bacterium]